ncbi:peptidyl-Lys metalloendopeptidase [Flagelloscypha sp. PMI_526]|nr:peptidyl-Lys metalloendopeptidase [Flagelloscypha sp. PMI_526]
MFSNTLRAALIALCALTVSATKELTLSVAGPASVDGVQNLKVTTSIVNTGDETLKILKDVRGPLSTLPTETFNIVAEDGTTPTFSGVKAKYVPSSVIEDGRESFFTVLAPGESAKVEHDLSKAYNFTLSGEKTYTINAKPTFLIVDEANKATEITAKTKSHSARISGTLAVARRSNLAKRISYNGCSSSQQSALVTAAASAQTYAADALSYLNSHTSATTRYTTWFGTYTSSRHSTVVSHFSAISGGSFSSFTYDCTCTDNSLYAYVYSDDYGHIYLCGYFWQVANTGTDSKAGTLIHECSHFTANGGTDDYAYGQTAAKSLATSNPDHAVFNADSHEYFAENNPVLS